jgi:hypothetical protein
VVSSTRDSWSLISSRPSGISCAWLDAWILAIATVEDNITTNGQQFQKYCRKYLRVGARNEHMAGRIWRASICLQICCRL